MSVTNDPTPGGELTPDTSGQHDLPEVETPASSHEGTAGCDVMAPWGEAGPPGSDWRADILGDGYESRSIELIDDAEGPCVATLVRATPPKNARMTILYLHGRNDYFFQTEMAGRLREAGAAFYALDMRKYGRSLRPHQTIGYTDDLSVYDEEIGEAIEIIRSERDDEPFVLMGHSTGGLIATLWAHRHPGVLDGLILNSAWLEMQSMAAWRGAMAPVIGRIASRNPMWEVPAGGAGHYGRSLAGRASSELPIPEGLAPEDPSVTGWPIAHEWKRPESYPVPASWLEAIMAGHETVEKDVHLECPVLSMVSTSSYVDEEWCERAFTSDTVLDPEVIAQRSLGLSNLVTIARFSGKHDLVLSDAPVREAVYATMRG
ncbi:MAG: alpha/beta hydrolase, partial [Schaalia odontolytica]